MHFRTLEGGARGLGDVATRLVKTSPPPDSSPRLRRPAPPQDAAARRLDAGVPPPAYWISLRWFSGNQRSKIKQFGQTIGHSKTGWSWHHQEQFICMTTSFSVVCKNITNCELLHKYPVLHYVCCKIMVLLWKITDEILLIPSHVVFEKSCISCDIIDIVVMRYWSKVRPCVHN